MSGLVARSLRIAHPHILGVIVSATLAVLVAAPLSAQVNSPGIAPSRIEVDEPLRQGDEIRLPSLSITNRGDESSTFIVEAVALSNQGEAEAQAAWFEFDPDRIEIAEGRGAAIAVRLKVPRDARPGAYRVLLRVRADTQNSAGGGAVISVAVATTLLFTVENRDFHFYDPVTDFFRDRAPFSYIGVGLLLALLAVYLIRQRFKFRISFGVERRE